MFLSELQSRMIQQQIMNRFKFLQSWFSMEEFPHDKLLICKQTYQNETYKKTFFYGKREFGVETGSHHLQKKNGDYHKIFHNLYLEEDLPEIILWETSPDIRKALTMEESGTYVNNEKQGHCTISYRDKTSGKILCQEEFEFKDNVKTGRFTRIYNFYHKKQRMIENGIHFNNSESKSDVVIYDDLTDKKISTVNIQKTKYEDKSHKDKHRTPESSFRIKCEYTIQSDNRYEEGHYSYSLIDIQYYLIQPQSEFWRRGEFFFKNRCPDYYEEFVKQISIIKQLPVELELHINSFLKVDENKRMGFFTENKKKESVYRFKKGILSPDEKFIILEDVNDNYDGTKTNIVFEKELLLDSPLFDNESFCFVDEIYIGLPNSKQSQYYEPIFITFLNEREQIKKSVLRVLFDRKDFRGRFVFKNGNRNFITRDNVLFLSRTEFLKREDHEQLITLRRNPNFVQRPRPRPRQN